MNEWTTLLETLIQHINAMEGWINGPLIYAMLQRVAVIFLIAFLFSKSRAFELLIKDSMRKRDWLALYVIFAAISILGTLLGNLVTIQAETSDWLHTHIVSIEYASIADAVPVSDLQANTQVESRTIGTILAGFLGGPLLGVSVGITAGTYRYFMGGDAAIGGSLGTALTGLLAGLVYLLVLKTRPEERFNWKLVFITACLGEIAMKLLVLLSNQPVAKGIAMIQITAIPNIIGNASGAALFIILLSDYDRIGSTFSANALNMAERFARIFKRKLPVERTAALIARTLQRETGAAAVAVTRQANDTQANTLLAFTGIGDDHHHPGDNMAEGLIRKAINTQTTLYLDGYHDHFRCKTADKCPLHSALIIPVIVKGKAKGAILLFEPRHRFFPKISRELGKSLARLLSEQILAARYQDQLAHAELKRWQARVDPHFLSNALNTIASVTRREQNEAIDLLKLLASLMRERLNPENETNTLQHEISLLNDYIRIEQARFKTRLKFSIDINPALCNILIPGFVLQLVVENAIKHGTSQLLEPAMGEVQVRAHYSEASDQVHIDVIDNAGLYCEEKAVAARQRGSYGLEMVEELIRTQFNSNQYGISIHCKTDVYTQVTITLPRYFESND